VSGEEEFTRTERRFGDFERSFTLPETADGDSVSAKYDLGVLAVTIPKKAKPAPRKIEVQH
jgi:HSP20 family protein